jgi:hypothetical protein
MATGSMTIPRRGVPPEIDFSMDRVIQISLMATILSLTPFFLFGIWCTLGLFFRHTTCYGWGWLLCFILSFFFSDILETGSLAIQSLVYRYLPVNTIAAFLLQAGQSLSAGPGPAHPRRSPGGSVLEMIPGPNQLSLPSPQAPKASSVSTAEGSALPGEATEVTQPSSEFLA